MKTRVFVLTAVIYVLIVLASWAVIRWIQSDKTWIPQVVGGIAGSQVAGYLRSRQKTARSQAGFKAGIGVLLAILCACLSLTLRLWERYPEVEIPIAAIGTFFFPLVLVGTIEKALERAPRDKTVTRE